MNGIPGVPASDKVGIAATAKPPLVIFAAKPKVPKEVMDRVRLEDFVSPAAAKRQRDAAPAGSSIN